MMTMMTMTKMKYIFWIAAVLVGYSYLAYPAWLWLRSWWSPRPVRRGFVESPAAPTVSAVMVVRNEESVIARKLDNLLTLDYPQGKLDAMAPRPFSPVMPAIPGFVPL